MAYFPPPEASGGWRSLVVRNQTPTAAQKTAIRNTAQIDWDLLKLANDYSRSFTTSSRVLVIRNGWIAGEWGNLTNYTIASATKSLTGLCFAKLFDLSTAGSLPRTIGPEDFAHMYLPSTWDDADVRKRDIRIRHLLTMSSGLEPHDNPSQPDYTISLVLNRPVRVPPETEWSYASLPVDLLSIILQRTAGKKLRDFFNQQIGAPLGIPALSWGSLGSYNFGSIRAQITPRNLARVGHLMLMNGAWDSGTGQRQVVSSAQIAALRTWPSFLENVTFRATPGSPFMVEPGSQLSYGRLWWLNRTSAMLGSAVPNDAYYAHGFNETLLVVVPGRSLVVVRFGPEPDVLPAFRREFMMRVMAAML
jgi:CubicO group peptidase (beta-lactamase class C family)